MKKHYNLYYLLWEDLQKHPLPEERSQQIWQNIEQLCLREKPPDRPRPP